MKRISFFLVSLILLASGVISAQEATPSAAVPQNEQQTQLEVTKPEQQAQTEVTKPEPPKAEAWYEKTNFNGDFRYRHEMISEPGKTLQNKERIRARYGIKADPLDYLTAVFQLATNYNDPVSTNQTLGDGFSGKAVRIDLAYFDWHPNYCYLKGLHLFGGKMKNPFYDPGKSQLIWDSDLNPEGLALSYNKDIMKDLNLFGAFSGFYLLERATRSDSWLLGLQGGFKYKIIDDKLYLKSAIGYFDLTSIKGYPTIYDITKSYGNTVDASKNYAFNYREFEFAGEVGGKVWKYPVSAFGDFVKNTAAGVVNDLGWLAGFSIGEAVEPLTWALRYDYRKLESDAVLGVFPYSDSFGGGTNGKGHQIVAEMAVAKNVKLGVTYLYDKKGVSGGTKYQRAMFDFSFKI